MAEQITTISDKSQMKFIFMNFFSKLDVFLRTKSGDLKIYFLGYHDDNAAFRIPNVKNVPDVVIAFTRNDISTIHCSMKLLEKNQDTYIFIPVKIQIISSQKKEDRMLVDNIGGDGGKNVFYMYNYMSDFYIKSSLEMNNKKNDQVKERIIFDLQKHFKSIKIFFLHEVKNDLRMKYALENKMTIFIPDLNTDPEDKYVEMYKFYLENIFPKEKQNFIAHGFISEATVPILHRNYIPYGYLQLNNREPMTESHLALVKKMALIIDHLLIKNKMFTFVETKFLVTDISAGGVGIVFRNRGDVRHFRKDSHASFEIMLPTGKNAIIGAIVRNITFIDSSLIKVGFQIMDLDQTSRQNYFEYLSSKGLDKTELEKTQPEATKLPPQ